MFELFQNFATHKGDKPTDHRPWGLESVVASRVSRFLVYLLAHQISMV